MTLPKVLGLDLSLASTGVAGPGWVDRIVSKGHRGDSLSDRWVRLRQIVNGVEDFTKTADLVVVEGPSYGSAHGSHHDRSGLWWLVVDRLRYRGIAVAEVPPACRCRYATGRGNASKDQVLAAVVRRYPQIDVAGNDEADALVLYAMGVHHLGRPIAAVPQTHATALAGVSWPFLVAS